MKEVIMIHVGQCGIQIGNQCWQLFCQEHNIGPDGIMKSEDIIADTKPQSVFFQELSNNKYVPRSIFVDLEPMSVDEVRHGMYGKLYHPDHLISHNCESASTWARGHYTTGKEIIDKTLGRIHKIVEHCDNLQGFIIFHSVSGGTGSGFCNLLVERLGINYSKKTRFGFIVYPSPNLSNLVVEPYNAMMTTTPLVEEYNLCILVNNEALYNVCQHNLDIEQAYYSNINNLIAQSASSLTASMRFGGTLNADLQDIITNLVAYPRLHFVQSSYSPFIPRDKQYIEHPTVNDITNQVFSPNNLMVSCKPEIGKYMACSMMYRGLISPYEVSQSVSQIKSNNNIKFVDWCPTGFKVSINAELPTEVPGGDIGKVQKAVYMLSNSTSVEQIFSRLEVRFDRMYAKRAFVHWFVQEGQEEFELSRARESTAELVADYYEAGEGLKLEGEGEEEG